MQESPSFFYRFAKALLLVFIGITILYRFFHLGEQSFWLDEIYTAEDTAENLSFYQVFKNVTQLHQAHPPLYFLILHGFLKLSHLSGEAGFRSISLFFSLLTVPVLYGIGKRIKNEWLGLGFISLYSTSSLCLWFSMEARSYSFSFFLITLLTYLLLFQIEKPSKWKLICIAFFSLCFLYTSYFSVFIIPSVYLFYLFYDGKWNKKRFLEVLISGLVVSILYIPLLTIVTGQTSIALEFIKKPQPIIFREAWVYFFTGGSVEYYFYAFALAASPFLFKKYLKDGGFGVLLIMQVSLFIGLGFLFSYTILPILHHKYLVYIYLPLLYLILLNFSLVLPRPAFIGLVILLSVKNLFFNSYLAMGEINKSPYKPYVKNIFETESRLPVVTNIVPFANYYSGINNYNLTLLPNTLSADSNQLLLKNGFWEFHMHGPFQFFPGLHHKIKDSLTHIGDAKFDVISYISLYVPTRNCYMIKTGIELNRFNRSKALQVNAFENVSDGNYNLVFKAHSGQDWKKAGISIEIDKKLIHFEMMNLEKFYSYHFTKKGPQNLQIKLMNHPELPRPVLGDIYLLSE
jgi:hypothetical protein